MPSIQRTVSSLIIGTSSERPSAVGNEGVLYIESDTTAILYSDGTNWVPILSSIASPMLNGLRHSVTTKTTTSTLVGSETVIRADATTGAFVITLPTAVGITGTIYTVKKTDTTSNIVTIDGAGTETIEGLLDWKLRYPNDFVEIVSDGTNWRVTSHSEYSFNSFLRKGATPNRRYIAGLMPNSHSALLTSTTAPAVNTLWALPLLVPELTKFDMISCQVTTIGAASNLRMGIYTDDGSGAYPGALIHDSGAVAGTLTGIKDSPIAAASQIFQPGLYWLTYVCSATSPQIRILPGSGYYCFGGYDGTLSTTPAQYAWSVAFTFAALPATFPTTSPTAITTASAVGTPIPALGLRSVGL